MGSKRFDEQGVLTREERIRIFARELGQPSFALALLVGAVKNAPELSAFMEAETIAGENPSKRRGERPTRKPKGVTPTADAPHTRVSPLDRLRKIESLLPLVTDYANGLTQAQIAEKHRRPDGAQATDPSRRGHTAHLRVLTDDDLRQARKAMKERASSREIACGLGVAHTMLLRVLERFDGPPESHHAHVDRRLGKPDHRRAGQESDSDQCKRESGSAPASKILGPILGWLTGLELVITYLRRE